MLKGPSFKWGLLEGGRSVMESQAMEMVNAAEKDRPDSCWVSDG